MSAGQKSEYLDTFLTTRQVLRNAVTADSSENDPTIPVVSVHLDTSVLGQIRQDSLPGKLGTVAPSGCVAARCGNSASLVLYVRFNESATAAPVTVWIWGGIEPYPTSRALLVNSWCKYATYTVTGNSVLVLHDLPAAPMLVTVGTITGAGTVTIVEQHTE